jgi:DNA-binding SARP family transcriptional activator
VTADVIDLLESAPATQPVFICLFGRFRLLKAGHPAPISCGGKTATLLSSLALREHHRASRESLLETLWPTVDASRSAHALNNLVHMIRQLLNDALSGAPPIVYAAGSYELNTQAGVGVDIADFDMLVTAGERQWRLGDMTAATDSWRKAVALYHGDICAIDDDIRRIAERERLRSLYLSLLARLADYSFQHSDYVGALRYALKLLSHDLCREDAHRMVMRCHVRLGERAQALRQYQICEKVLWSEFEARPEPLTTALFERVRLDPAGV